MTSKKRDRRARTCRHEGFEPLVSAWREHAMSAVAERQLKRKVERVTLAEVKQRLGGLV